MPAVVASQGGGAVLDGVLERVTFANPETGYTIARIAPERGGAELWARNCRRCHNLRAPTSYSADQWEVVVNHMRVRANLTAKDARKIEEFLKAAN